MNIQLSNTEEFIDGKSTGALGQVLIRWARTQSHHTGGGSTYKWLWLILAGVQM